MSRNKNWSLLRQNKSKNIRRVSNILDCQHVHNVQIQSHNVGHRYNEMEYEHVNMLKIQNVLNLSDGKTSSTLSKYFNILDRSFKSACFFNALLQTKVSNSSQKQQLRGGNVGRRKKS